MSDATTTTTTIGDSQERRSRERIPSGWRVIAGKEFTDHILSIRFLILMLLFALIAAFAVYTVSGSIRDAASAATGRNDLFLLLFTFSPSGNDEFGLSYLAIVAFLGPLIGIAFGFDAVGSERSEGTLPRLVAQPIHRDDVVNGKFVAALAVVAMILAAVMLIIAGVGLVRLGVVPSLDQVLRLLAWYLFALLYVGIWLAFATLGSVVSKSAATAALATISVWLVMTVFWDRIVGLIVGVLAPGTGGTAAEQLGRDALHGNLSRISPSYLFQEVSAYLLDPGIRFIGLITRDQADRLVPAPLPFGQSLLLIWPQGVLMVAEAVICFAAAYIVFMRQEVRA
ncbi:MAG: ABC transporter permease [Candidatus Limnocylindrales bacterium]